MCTVRLLLLRMLNQCLRKLSHSHDLASVPRTSGNVKLLLPPRQSRGNSHFGLAFQPIKLKSPPGISPSFPSEISSLEAAKDFVNAHLDASKRDVLRWHLVIGALNGGEGSFTNVQLVLRNALDEEGGLLTETA
jgi:hypothetical protein